MGLSAEEWVDVVDWITMENVGLSPKSVQWPGIEAEAMLHKGIAASKSHAGAPAITISYFTFPDGAYLGWAIARYWGVGNWATTLWGRLPVDPPGAKEEAELILPLQPMGNGPRSRCSGARRYRIFNWPLSAPPATTAGAMRRDANSWDRVRRWSEYPDEE